MKTHTVAAIAGALAISFGASVPSFAKPVANPYFVPGLWRLHVVTYGASHAIMKRLSKTMCLTHQPRAMKPHGKMASLCRVTNHQMVGNTLTWTTACHSASLDMISQGRAVYRKTTLDEWVNGHVLAPEKMAYRVHVIGKRIGSCPAAKSGY